MLKGVATTAQSAQGRFKLFLRLSQLWPQHADGPAVVIDRFEELQSVCQPGRCCRALELLANLGDRPPFFCSAV